MNSIHEVNSSRSALRLTMAYACAGALWILSSDFLLSKLKRSPQSMLFGQLFKGLDFVAFTAFILYLVARTGFREIRQRSVLRGPEAMAAVGLYASDLFHCVIEHKRGSYHTIG